MSVLLRLAAVAVSLAVAAPPAQAAFPGRNGAIGYALRAESGGIGPLTQSTGLAARRLGAEPRDIVRCRRTEGEPGGCTLFSYRSPSYSPDGRRLVFDAGEQLGLIGASGAGMRLLPAVTADDSDPAFAPGGGRIVFAGLNAEGRTDLYVRRLDGENARLIVTDASQPAWSSRNEIAYVRDGNVYVARPTGSHRRFVTSGISPDWSPGGARLAVVRPSPGNTFADGPGRLFTVGARGRGLRAVFPRVRDASGPVWSPDGAWLAFERFDAGIFAKRRGSSRPARQVAVSQVSGESGSNVSFDPAWRPLPR
jgi:dipeptidyl aminopeptidase/acylaminoacyl peptidase